MNTLQTATAHQAFQPMPKLDTPLVTEDRKLSAAWYRWFVSIWVRSGCNTGHPVNSAQNLALIGNDGGVLTIYDVLTGAPLGVIASSSLVGAPVVPESPGASPFLFSAPVGGTLVASSGMIEVSRDGVTFYTSSLLGGSAPLLAGDQARVSWTVTPPSVEFFPWG